MVTSTRPTLNLFPETDRDGYWCASFEGRKWLAKLDWPSEANLSRLRWLVEEGPSTSLAEQSKDSRLLAAQVGALLWESLVNPAPLDVRQAISDGPLHVRAKAVQAAQVAALSLLNRGDFGPLRMLSQSFLVNDAMASSTRTAPFRSLLVTARPLGAYDAPYLGVAQPLAKSLAKLGCRFERVFPPRKSELIRVLQTARSAGEPFTAIIFDGHGYTTAEGRSFIALESGLGRPALFDAKAFSECLGKEPAPLVVLAACRTAHTDTDAELSTSFAADLAIRTGSEVVAMTYSIASRHAAIVATSIVETIGRGEDVAEGVAQARRNLVSLEPSSLSWSAPVHFSASNLRFTLRRDEPLSIPSSVARHHECREVDRGLEKARLFVIYGTPLVGKTTFLDQYEWWLKTRAAKTTSVTRLNARAFNRPSDMLEVLTDPKADPNLIIVDAAEHWSHLPGSGWDSFLAATARSDMTGCRWLIASRSRLDIADILGSTDKMLLAGLGGAGIRSTAERYDLQASIFGCAAEHDPWLPLLVIATRGDPILLSWAASHVQPGNSAKETLWRLVFPDSSVRLELEELGADPGEIETVNPMLGWGFGTDIRHALAWLEFPDDRWETEEYRARAEEYGKEMNELGQRGLALPGGGRWTLSPTHATLLRAKRPVETWSPLERERYADYYSCFGSSSLGSSNPEVLAQVKQAIKNSQSVIDILECGVSVERLMWVSVILSLPNAIAAAQLACETDQAKVLGNIASGLCRAAYEFDLNASNIAWLEHWVGRMRELGARHVDIDRGQEQLQEELERLALIGGDKSIQIISQQRLVSAAAKILPAIEHDSAPAHCIRQVAEAYRQGHIEFVSYQFENFVSALKVSIFCAGTIEIEPDDIVALSAAIYQVAEKSVLMYLEISICHLFQRRGDFARAEESVLKALQLAKPDAVYEQYVANSAAAEILGVTGGKGQIEAAQRAVHFAKRLGDELSIGQAQLQLASTWSTLGDLAQARYHCAEAIPKLKSLAMVHQIALLTYAKILSMQGELELAEAYRSEVEKSSAGGNPIIYLEALSLAPVLLLQANRFDDNAQAVVLHLLEEAREGGSAHAQGIASWYLAELHSVRGEFEAALSFAQSAIGMLRPNQIEGYLPRANAVLAQAAYQLDRFDLACEAQRQAAMGFERHYLASEDMAFPWAVLETYAVVAENIVLAIEAEGRVAALAGSQWQYPTGQLAITALGWEQLGDIEKATRRARLALADRASFNEFLIENLERLVALAAVDDVSARIAGEVKRRQNNSV